MIKIKKVAPNAEILVLYGSTEVEPMAHIEANEMINQKSRAHEDSEWVDEGVNVGLFDEGLQVKFLKIIKGSVEISSKRDWDNVTVREGEIGELIVAGEHVCRNYFNNKEAFKSSKILDENGTVWHRTGDLGRRDVNKQLWLVGRVHNAIDRAGTYCFPVRSEMVLKKLPFVAKAAYLGMPDEELGESTYCIICPKDLSDLKNEILLGSHRDEIKRIMEKNGIIYDEIVFTSSIPMDPRHHSKVEYGALRDELISRKV
jgi:acyl-CoA synthetase (AMP-forming)/AMP-acid ligase II